MGLFDFLGTKRRQKHERVSREERVGAFERGEVLAEMHGENGSLREVLVPVDRVLSRFRSRRGQSDEAWFWSNVTITEGNTLIRLARERGDEAEVTRLKRLLSQYRGGYLAPQDPVVNSWHRQGYPTYWEDFDG